MVVLPCPPQWLTVALVVVAALILTLCNMNLADLKPDVERNSHLGNFYMLCFVLDKVFVFWWKYFLNVLKYFIISYSLLLFYKCMLLILLWIIHQACHFYFYIILASFLCHSVITWTSDEMVEYSGDVQNVNNLVCVKPNLFLPKSTSSSHSADLRPFNNQPMLSIKSQSYFFLNQ